MNLSERKEMRMSRGSIERLYPAAWQDRAIRFFAQAMIDRLPAFVAAKWRPYVLAEMRLIRDRPEAFREHGYDLTGVMFRGFVRRGAKLVACDAYWADDE